jgi:hypothetical protein
MKILGTVCYRFSMNISYSYHTTSTQETLEPHLYISLYSDGYTKKTIRSYKFKKSICDSEYIQSMNLLVAMCTDVCIDRYIHTQNNLKTIHIYTTPPSTMYARKEKDVDSMMFLLQQSMKRFDQSIASTSSTYVHSIYNIYHKHLVNKRAQHIGGTRSIRTRDLHTRYYISFLHKLTLLYLIHVKKYSHLSYTIIDDVSSTGATLVACKQTLMSYLEYVQKKNPSITFDVQIISLCH